jgi:hypothetical protein
MDFSDFQLKHPCRYLSWKSYVEIKEKIEGLVGFKLDVRSTYTFGFSIMEAYIPTESAKEATKIIYDSYRKRPEIIYWLSRELVEMDETMLSDFNQ